MSEKDDRYAEAYAALDAALLVKGSARHVLFDEVLRLWRLARDAGGELISPSDTPDTDAEA